MLLQAAGWAAVTFGITSTWLLGRKHRAGWLTSITACVLWFAVNLAAHIWAGLLSAVIGGLLAARNWRCWTRDRND